MTSEQAEKIIFRTSFNFLRKYSDNIANATNKEWLQLINEFDEVLSTTKDFKKIEHKLHHDILLAVVNYLEAKYKKEGTYYG